MHHDLNKLKLNSEHFVDLRLEPLKLNNVHEIDLPPMKAPVKMNFFLCRFTKFQILPSILI